MIKRMIQLKIIHKTPARESVTERVFYTLQDARCYINAITKKMNRARKWALRTRDAHSEQWVSIKGGALMSFIY